MFAFGDTLLPIKMEPDVRGLFNDPLSGSVLAGGRVPEMVTHLEVRILNNYGNDA